MMIRYAVKESANPKSTQDNIPLIGLFGFYGIVGGIFSTAGGTVMWTFGQKKLNR